MIDFNLYTLYSNKDKITMECFNLLIYNKWNMKTKILNLTIMKESGFMYIIPSKVINKVNEIIN